MPRASASPANSSRTATARRCRRRRSSRTAPGRCSAASTSPRPVPNAADATVRVRGMGLQITTPDGDVWRSAMIDAPVFAVSTPAGVLRTAPDGAQGGGRDEGVHRPSPRVPGLRRLGRDRALDLELRRGSVQRSQFIPVHRCRRARRVRCAGRCSPRRRRCPSSPTNWPRSGPNYLEQEIAQRVAGAPQRWTMVVTVAEPGDNTADPTKAWPKERRTVEVGTLVVNKVDRRAGRSVPRHQLRSHDPAARRQRLRRSVPRRALVRLCPVLRPAHVRGEGLSPHGQAAGSTKP